MVREIVIIIVAVFVIGCSNELELFTEPKPEPIITSILDLYSNVHYVRVQRTYQGYESTAFDINSDELYFNSVQVRLYGVRKGDTVWAIPFSEVQLSKEDGKFPNTEHRVYKYDGYLQLQDQKGLIESLILKVNVADINMESIAKTSVLEPLQFSFSGGSLKRLQLFGDYISAISLKTRRLVDGLNKFSYKELSFNCIVREIFPEEIRIDTVCWTTNQGWDMGTGPYFVFPERIFNRLSRILIPNDTLLARNLISISITGRIPDLAFEEMYVTSINRADRDINPFTNFSNGYGIFVGVSSETKQGLTLAYRSMDSLCMSPRWQHLKFKTW
ncbi:MAG: hypothetical protein U9N86_18065 [Bacteroidota bacterium]|nr:hypothetical protein [Bacteroidota bacterium]